MEDASLKEEAVFEASVEGNVFEGRLVVELLGSFAGSIDVFKLFEFSTDDTVGSLGTGLGSIVGAGIEEVLETTEVLGNTDEFVEL